MPASPPGSRPAGHSEGRHAHERMIGPLAYGVGFQQAALSTRIATPSSLSFPECHGDARDQVDRRLHRGTDAGITSSQCAGTERLRHGSCLHPRSSSRRRRFQQSIWDLVDGAQQLFVITSWGGCVQSSSRLSTNSGRASPVEFDPSRHGVWMINALRRAAPGTYCLRAAGDECGRPIGGYRIGGAHVLRTTGGPGSLIVLMRPTATRCASNVASCSAASECLRRAGCPAAGRHLFFSQYRGRRRPGRRVARLAWADRGTLRPAKHRSSTARFSKQMRWRAVTTGPIRQERLCENHASFHDGNQAADVYWAPPSTGIPISNSM